MTLSFALAFDSTLDLFIAVAGFVLAVGAGVAAWRWTSLRDARVRAAIAVLRGLFVLIVVLLISNPEITRTVRILPVLKIVWDRATLDVDDAPNGSTRTRELERSLSELRRKGIDSRFEVVEGLTDREVHTSILLSDGYPVDLPADLPGRVFALTPVRDAAIPDVAVLEMTTSGAMVAGAPTAVTIVVRARGAAGRSLALTVSDGARVLATSTREIRTADEVLSTDVTVAPQSSGWQRLVVEAAGITGERSLENNRLEKWCDVEQESRRVLFVEGEPTWEGKFIRRALESDANVTVDYVAQISKAAVIAQPEDSTETVKKDDKKAKPATTGGWPDLHAALASARLFGYEAVILGPLDASALNNAELARLAEFVDRRGGGLFVLGSNGYSGSILSTRGPLELLLPATIPASSLGRREVLATPGSNLQAGSVLMKPADGAAHHPAFGLLGDDPAAAIGRLQRLDSGYLHVGALKPGAVALAVDASPQAADKPPLVASQDYGLGRVVLVAPSDTWRLAVGAKPEDEAISARFWSGLVAWASSGALPRVTATALPASVRADASVHVEVLVRDQDFNPLARTSVRTVAMLEDSDDPIEISLVADPSVPGLLAADCRLDTPGSWRIESELADGTKVLSRVHVEPRDRNANADRPDPAAAERLVGLAQERGGNVFTTGEIDGLYAALGAPEPVDSSVSSRPAKSAWWALLLPLLFAAEIFLRRWYAVE